MRHAWLQPSPCSTETAPSQARRASSVRTSIGGHDNLREMPKIALVGAGSATFSRRLIADLLCWPSLRDSEIALVDPDTERLGLIEALAKKMVQQTGAGARISASAKRE